MRGEKRSTKHKIDRNKIEIQNILIVNHALDKIIPTPITSTSLLYIVKLEKIRYRIMIPEFYVIQICKH